MLLQQYIIDCWMGRPIPMWTGEGNAGHYLLRMPWTSWPCLLLSCHTANELRNTARCFCIAWFTLNGRVFIWENSTEASGKQEYWVNGTWRCWQSMSWLEYILHLVQFVRIDRSFGGVLSILSAWCDGSDHRLVRNVRSSPDDETVVTHWWERSRLHKTAYIFGQGHFYAHYTYQ